MDSLYAEESFLSEVDNEESSNSGNQSSKKKKPHKTVQKIDVENADRKLIPLFLSKLSTTYFKTLTDTLRNNLIRNSVGGLKKKTKKQGRKRRKNKSEIKSVAKDGIAKLKELEIKKEKLDISIQTENAISHNPSSPETKYELKEAFYTLPNLNTDSNKEETGNNIEGIVSQSHEMCLICYTNNPDAVFMNCGHSGICYECALAIMEKDGTCYLCREKIEKVLQIDVTSKKGSTYRVSGAAKIELKLSE